MAWSSAAMRRAGSRPVASRWCFDGSMSFASQYRWLRTGHVNRSILPTFLGSTPDGRFFTRTMAWSYVKHRNFAVRRPLQIDPVTLRGPDRAIGPRGRPRPEEAVPRTNCAVFLVGRSDHVPSCAVARTVPFEATSCADRACCAADVNGAAQAPYSPESWNTPIVSTVLYRETGGVEIRA